MYEKYKSITDKKQKQLFIEIDREYKKATTKLKGEIELIVNDKGKTQRQKINALQAILVALWVVVGDKIISHSKDVIGTTYAFYQYASVQLGNPLILPNKEISNLIGKTIKKRTDIIKWNNVIKGNTKRLDKAVSKIVKDGIKSSKTPRQIQAELEKTINIS